MYKVTQPKGNKPQWICAAVIGFGGFSSGLGMSWAAIFFPKVRSGEVGTTFTLLEESFIASISHVGQLCASGISSNLQNKLGRRCTLLIAVQAPLCAWILLLLSRSFWAILSARFLIGIYSGFIITVCPPFNGEIAISKIRGRISALLQWSFVAGFCFQTSVGSYLSYDAVSIMSFCVTLIEFFALLNIPESPYSLIRLGRIEHAERNLKWLRGGGDIQKDFEYIKYNVDLQMTRKTGIKDIFRWRASRRAFIQAFTLNLVQKLTGFLALSSFTSVILPGDWFIFKSEKYPMVWNTINLTFISISYGILDYVDRKVLLTISSTGVAIFSSTLAIWFFLYEKTNIDVSHTIWIPYVALSLNAASYAFGLFFLPIIYLGEIFPMNIKSLAITIITFTTFIATIIMVQIFLPLKKYVGIFSNFLLYAVTAFVGIYVSSVITETRKRSLEHIQRVLEGTDSETRRNRGEEQS